MIIFCLLLEFRRLQTSFVLEVPTHFSDLRFQKNIFSNFKKVNVESGDNFRYYRVIQKE